MSSTRAEPPIVGTWVSGFEVPVIDERSVRAAAGLLLTLGALAVGVALATGNPQAMRPFGMLFLLDMVARVALGDRWSPTLAFGRLVTRRRPPRWVGAPQKVFAWSLGIGIAALSCASMGVLGAPFAVTLALCSVCLVLLFLEAAFGICVGCALQRALTRTRPQHCPSGRCTASH